ncbi:MAG: NTP transferase domain-containing protein [Candidatus Thiodiazotropha sp. 4PDIV1]
MLAKQLESLGLNVVENAHADEVMGLSLETVVSASIDAAGWIVVLVDMPWISPQTIATVAQAVEKDASLVQPVYQGRPGHPVGFNRKWGEQLQALKGDRGARGMLEKKSWIKQDTLGKEESKKVKKDNCPF